MGNSSKKVSVAPLVVPEIKAVTRQSSATKKIGNILDNPTHEFDEQDLSHQDLVSKNKKLQ